MCWVWDTFNPGVHNKKFGLKDFNSNKINKTAALGKFEVKKGTIQ